MSPSARTSSARPSSPAPTDEHPLRHVHPVDARAHPDGWFEFEAEVPTKALTAAQQGPGLAVGVVVHLIGDRWRTRSPQARAAVTAFYIAVTAVVAWRLYPHLEGTLS